MGDNMVGDFIKFSRIQKNMSLRDLSDVSSISPSQLSKIERGVSAPSKDTLLKLSYALNVDKSDLIALGGYLDEEIKESVITNLASIITTDYDQTLDHMVHESPIRQMEYVQAVGRITRNENEPLVETLINVLEAYYEDLTAEEAEFLSKEMYAAYKIGLRRLNSRGGRSD